jgi:hypothetical protein
MSGLCWLVRIAPGGPPAAIAEAGRAGNTRWRSYGARISSMGELALTQDEERVVRPSPLDTDAVLHDTKSTLDFEDARHRVLFDHLDDLLDLFVLPSLSGLESRNPLVQSGEALVDSTEALVDSTEALVDSTEALVDSTEALVRAADLVANFDQQLGGEVVHV